MNHRLQHIFFPTIEPANPPNHLFRCNTFSEELWMEGKPVCLCVHTVKLDGACWSGKHGEDTVQISEKVELTKNKNGPGENRVLAMSCRICFIGFMLELMGI